MSEAGTAKAHAEIERLCRELDITNADHIVLWLEHNAFDSTIGWLACRIIEAHEQEMALVRLERDRLLAALDPNETKAAYMGEVKDDVVMFEYDGYGEYQEVSRKHTISWTAIKDIMTLIRKQAEVEG